MSERRLGRLPKREDPRRDRLMRVFRAENLPTPPAEVDWLRAVHVDLGMMLNDTYGDCVVAGFAHYVMIATSNATGVASVIPDDTIHDAYFELSPDDTGVNLEEGMGYWRDKGLGGHRIYGWAPIDPKDDAQVAVATWLFGPLYAGVTLARGDNDPNTKAWSTPCHGNIGGHCVPVAFHGAMEDDVVSWAEVIPMTRNYRHQRCDELYALLSPDWFNPTTGLSPAGFSLQHSGQYLVAMGGSHVTLPAGPPTPSNPSPLPSPPAQAVDPLDFGDLL